MRIARALFGFAVLGAMGCGSSTVPPPSESTTLPDAATTVDETQVSSEQQGADAPLFDLQWAVQAHAAAEGNFANLLIDHTGALWVSGQSRARTDWSEAMAPQWFVAKLDASGKRMFSRTTDARLVALSKDDGPLVVSYPTPSDLGTGVKEQNVMLAELSPIDGSVVRRLGVRIADPQHASPWTVAVAPDGAVLLSGGTQEDLGIGDLTIHADKGTQFVVRLEADSPTTWKATWARTWRGPDIMRIDESGLMFVAGRVCGVVDFGGGPRTAASCTEKSSHSDVFVASFAADGSHRWSTIVSNEGNEVAPLGLAVHPSGGVVLTTATGMFRFDRDGTLLWEKKSASPILRDDVVVMDDGTIVNIWMSSASEYFAWDATLEVYDAGGALRWRTPIGIIQPSHPGHRLVARGGDLFIATTFSGPLSLGGLVPNSHWDFFIAKLTRRQL